MNKNIGIMVGIIVIIGIGYFAFSGDKTEINEVINNVPEVQNEAPANEVNNTMPVPGFDVPEMVVENEQGAQVSAGGSYEVYSPDKIALAETGDVVLFFHASWCPSCRALNKNIENNVDAIPDGVTILKTDYDKETELKKKYGVTTQHTLVQVDKDGNLIKKWSGGSKLENLLSEIQ